MNISTIIRIIDEIKNKALITYNNDIITIFGRNKLININIYNNQIIIYTYTFIFYNNNFNIKSFNESDIYRVSDYLKINNKKNIISIFGERKHAHIKINKKYITIEIYVFDLQFSDDQFSNKKINKYTKNIKLIY